MVRGKSFVRIEPVVRAPTKPSRRAARITVLSSLLWVPISLLIKRSL